MPQVCIGIKREFRFGYQVFIALEYINNFLFNNTKVMDFLVNSNSIWLPISLIIDWKIRSAQNEREMNQEYIGSINKDLSNNAMSAVAVSVQV